MEGGTAEGRWGHSRRADMIGMIIAGRLWGHRPGETGSRDSDRRTGEGPAQGRQEWGGRAYNHSVSHGGGRSALAILALPPGVSLQVVGGVGEGGLGPAGRADGLLIPSSMGYAPALIVACSFSCCPAPESKLDLILSGRVFFFFLIAGCVPLPLELGGGIILMSQRKGATPGGLFR